MKKIRFTVICALILIPCLVFATAFAVSNIKLIINNEQQNIPLQLSKNTVIGPVRQLAEALGATVEWDNSTQTVTITDKDKFRINQLESAVSPKDSLDTATKWAEAAKTRNGALRYALLSSDLREKQYQEYKELNWVIGVSSPWVEDYKVDAINKSEDTIDYKIDYFLTDSTGTKYTSTETISVKEVNDNGSLNYYVIKCSEPAWGEPGNLIQ